MAIRGRQIHRHDRREKVACSAFPREIVLFGCGGRFQFLVISLTKGREKTTDHVPNIGINQPARGVSPFFCF
jgi:hypothetical protein